MRKLLGTMLLASALAGCGEKSSGEPAKSTATPPAPHSEEDHALARARAKKESLRDYSQGVQDYYGEEAITEPVGDEHIDIEIEYHQPPRPSPGVTQVGEPLTLTGTNIGVRFVVTPRKVHSVGKHTAVDLHLENTGITVYEDGFRNAAVTYDNGKTVEVVAKRAKCSNGFDALVRIDVLRKRRGCLLFPKSGDAKPKTFHFALENVPYTAGGIWNLR
jgi:hypothetical protein